MAGKSRSVLQRCCCRREEDAETELEGEEETEVGARLFAYEVLGARDVILRRSLDPWVSGNVATFDEVGMVKVNITLEVSRVFVWWQRGRTKSWIRHLGKLMLRLSQV